MKSISSEDEVNLVVRLSDIAHTAGKYSQYRRLTPNLEIVSKSGDFINYLCLIREIVSGIMTGVIIELWA